MTRAQTYSWVFYAVALATRSSPAKTAAIEMVADGINRARPTQRELRASFSWLRSEELIEKRGKTYLLTTDGESLIADHADAPSTSEAWDSIRREFANRGIDDATPLDPRTMDTL